MSPILAQRTCSRARVPRTSHPWPSREITGSGAPESWRSTRTWVTRSWPKRTVLPRAPRCSSASRSWRSSATSSASSPSSVCLQRSSPSWRFSSMLRGLNGSLLHFITLHHMSFSRRFYPKRLAISAFKLGYKLRTTRIQKVTFPQYSRTARVP